MAVLGPSRGRGGSAATAMGNRLMLATPATSLEQPETQPCLCQVGQQPKAPCSRRVAPYWWRVALPSDMVHHGLAALPSPSGQTCSPHPETPPPVKAAAQASGLQDGGRWGLAGHVGDVYGCAWTPLPTKAAAWASGLQGEGGGGLTGHIGEVWGWVFFGLFFGRGESRFVLSLGIFLSLNSIQCWVCGSVRRWWLAQTCLCPWRSPELASQCGIVAQALL